MSYNQQGQLIAVNGKVVEYDAMGNPTKYKGYPLEWEQGRKLVSGAMNGNVFSYSYDGNGMRFKKMVLGTTTYYYYDDDQLLMESKNGKRTWYIYGVTGIEGMVVEGEYQNTVYYFDKNTLGDIIAIRSTSGNVLATYEYDAWGNCTVMNENGYVNTSSSFIGNINPIRYRGYYYDVETGFYYLQTRYYDPTICRFINADNYELVSTLASTPGQLNMYAYCRNNPIMYTDPTGEIAGWIIGLIAVGIILTASDIYNVVENVDYTVSKDGQSVSIENSQTIITPWVRWGYSFYLNHINAETKGIIKGSSVGVEYEWFLHNAAYWLGISRSQASPVDIGASIFSDNHPGLGDLMKVSYIILQHPVYTIWDLIANKGYGGR